VAARPGRSPLPASGERPASGGATMEVEWYAARAALRGALDAHPGWVPPSAGAARTASRGNPRCSLSLL
jgi:hypothetical protein